MADAEGVIEFVDIIEDQTMREELDESTGRRQMTIIEDREKKLHPTIQIRKKTKKREKLREFIIPVGAQLTIRDGDEVTLGDTLAKISREVYKTRDITGGLAARCGALRGPPAEGSGRHHRDRRRGHASATSSAVSARST